MAPANYLFTFSLITVIHNWEVDILKSLFTRSKSEIFLDVCHIFLDIFGFRSVVMDPYP